MRLMRIVLGALGVAAYDEDDLYEDWTSADQLAHFMGETVDPDQGSWPESGWPGRNAGRGWSQYDNWRNG